MKLLANLPDLPADVLPVLVLLLISLASWVKNRFFTKPEEIEPPELDDPMREVIWRRQMGEEPPPTIAPRPPSLPPATVRRAQAVVETATPPRLPVVRVVSEREAALARSFEDSYRIKEVRRSTHRAEIDKLLRSPYAAKNAILLTEILGPPVALKIEES